MEFFVADPLAALAVLAKHAPPGSWHGQATKDTARVTFPVESPGDAVALAYLMREAIREEQPVSSARIRPGGQWFGGLWFTLPER